MARTNIRRETAGKGYDLSKPNLKIKVSADGKVHTPKTVALEVVPDPEPVVELVVEEVEIVIEPDPEPEVVVELPPDPPKKKPKRSGRRKKNS